MPCAVAHAAEIVYATGVVEPLRWAKVLALSRKRIVWICDCEGKVVKKGDVLVKLDDGEGERPVARTGSPSQAHRA